MKRKPKTGRPLAKIDPATVQALARIHCTYAEMAAVLNCDESTLRRRFASLIKRGAEEGKASLRRMQFKAAEGGNATMMIWLGKQHLGQVDESRVRFEDVTKLTDEELAAKRKALGLA